MDIKDHAQRYRFNYTGPEYSLKKNDLQALKNWFRSYVDRFSLPGPDHVNIQIKEEHTWNVCREITDLAKSVGLTRGGTRLAEAIALLHDTGRFEQYARYGTFVDGISEDHAELGVKILEEQSVLKGIDSDVRDLMLHALSKHNKARVMEHDNEAFMFFTRLIRDADKLDIFRVVIDFYRSKDVDKKALGLGLRDDPCVTDSVVEDVMEERIVNSAGLRTLNDFKILQMGWVYDINFPASFQRIRERNYLVSIYETLPGGGKTDMVYRKVTDYLERRCRTTPGTTPD